MCARFGLGRQCETLPLRAAVAISPQYVSQPIQTLGVATVKVGAVHIRGDERRRARICCVGSRGNLTVSERRELRMVMHNFFVQ
jgi:hypothetical protein